MFKQTDKSMIIFTFLFALYLFFLGYGRVFSQETLTITTYYPSPYGSYREIRAQRMAIGDNYINNATVCWENCPFGVTPVPAATDLLVEGNVGIGTTGPAGRLHVQGPDDAASVVAFMPGADTVAGGTPSLNVGIGTTSPAIHLAIGDTDTGLQQQGDGELALYTNNSERVRIDNVGNVGIGTTTPAIDLAIGDTDTGLQQQGDGELALYTNNSERVRIDNVGNVGIGITNPQHALELGEGRALQARNLRLAPVPEGAESSGPLRWYTHTSGYYSAAYEPTLPDALDFKIKLRTGTMPSEVDKLVLRQNGLIIPAREGIDPTVSNYLQWQSADAGYYKADYSNWAFKLKVNTGSGEVEILQLTHDGDLKIARHIYAHTATAQKGLCGDVADLGEYIAVSSKGIEPGDVVVIGSEKEGSIKLSSQEYDKRLVGIISTNPSISLNGPQEKSRPLALAGIVPTKVTTINGSIKRGDPLTSSNIPGYAMKATKSGPIVGKALEDFDGVKGNKGKILVFVNVSWWQPEEEREAIKVLKHQIEDLRKQIASLTQNR